MLEFQVSEGAKNALLLSTLAGLSTGIGGLLAVRCLSHQGWLGVT